MKVKKVNPHLMSVEVDGNVISKKDAMVYYKGNFKMDKILFNVNREGSILKDIIGTIYRKATNENIELVDIKGSGELGFADEGRYLEYLSVNPNRQIVIEGENIVAFSPHLTYGTHSSVKNIIQSKGLTSTKIQNKTDIPGFVIISTKGILAKIEAPCNVDPNAIILYTGNSPKPKVEWSDKIILGQTSGETITMEFSNGVVLIDPCERECVTRKIKEKGIDSYTQTPKHNNNQYRNPNSRNNNNGYNNGYANEDKSNIENIVNVLSRYLK